MNIEYRDFAINLAKDAGEVMRKASSTHSRSVKAEKCSAADLVTETDEYLENLIRTRIQTTYPTHKFIGEESTSEGTRVTLTDEPTWIVDPIDGTSNFVNQFPFYCVSIALCICKETQLAVIYEPNADQLFHAVKGCGAFLNESRLHVSAETSLRNSLILTNWGGDRNETNLTVKLTNFARIIRAARGIRSMGSAALHICQVAQGCGEAFFEYGIHCWDFAAAILLVTEAGGVALDTDGGPVDLMSRRVLCACNESVARELAAILQSVSYTRD